jgi:glycosyltransferase involved in cell wall biosynthesis
MVENPWLSVVIPVFNEAQSLEPFWTELQPSLDGLRRSYEVIFIDDGSEDGSPDILRCLRGRHSEVRLITLRRNAGETAATDAGFKAARGNVLLTMDADLQHDPKDIPILLDHLSGWDAACGWRVRREDSWVRRLSANIANGLRNTLTGDDVRDSGCTLRAFRRDCLANLRLYAGFHRWLPTLLRLEGHRVVEVPVNHRPRLFGQSKYGIRNRVFRGVYDLLVVRWMKARHLRYDAIEEAPIPDFTGKT